MFREKIFEKRESEKGLKKPEINYLFFFSAHETRDDFEELSKLFKKNRPDILSLEIFGWTKENLKSVNLISQGKKNQKNF